MTEKISVPHVNVGNKSIEIIGSAESLKALGELMIQKSKLKDRLSATFYDGKNKSIEIITTEDLCDEDEIALMKCPECGKKLKMRKKKMILKLVIFLIRKYFKEYVSFNESTDIYNFSWTKELEDDLKN